MKKCPYCSEDIQDEAKKCRFCWEFLKNTEQNEEAVINLDTITGNEKSKMDYALGILFVTSLIKTKESMAHNCFFLTQIQDYKRIVISFKRLFNIPNIGGFVIWHIIYVIAIFKKNGST